ncbi:hypothetical protein I4U23_004334 [Adineta vaga]|nr:hypothetical protein I4U23_004334 [Adineta vaga]
MATSNGKSHCKICDQEKRTVKCEGCLQSFCYTHITDHRQELNTELDNIENNRDLFLQTLNEHINNPCTEEMLQKINDWEKESVNKIQQTANECRTLVAEYIHKNISEIENQLKEFTDQIRNIRKEDDFNEIDLNEFGEKLKQLQQQLHQPSNFSIQQKSTPFVKEMSVIVSSEQMNRTVDFSMSHLTLKAPQQKESTSFEH